MSTSYSIYRFAKPTKCELSGIDYFSEYDAFYLHMVDVPIAITRHSIRRIARRKRV